MSKRKVTEELRNKAIQSASAFFLCEELPDGWENLEQEELHEFIMDTIWEPLENWEAGSVFELIENAAYSTISFLEREGFVDKEN